MKTIASRQNPWFKRVREAIREHGDEIVIEGPKQVADAIAAGWSPIAVIARGDFVSDTAAGEQIVFSRELFDALADTKTTQGVIALFQRPHFSLQQILARHETIAVALDGVQDPGNVGTIVRLAAAFEAAGVILLPGCADAFGPKAIRASAGAILNVPLANATADELIASTLPIYAAEQTAKSSHSPSKDAILIFGSEGAGPSPEIRSVARPIAIAMSKQVESLNVATAAAILLAQSYEARRR